MPGADGQAKACPADKIAELEARCALLRIGGDEHLAPVMVEIAAAHKVPMVVLLAWISGCTKKTATAKAWQMAARLYGGQV